MCPTQSSLASLHQHAYVVGREPAVDRHFLTAARALQTPRVAAVAIGERQAVVLGQCAEPARRRMPFQISRTRCENHWIGRQPAYGKAAAGRNAGAQSEIDTLGDQVGRRIVEQEIDAEV